MAVAEATAQLLAERDRAAAQSAELRAAKARPHPMEAVAAEVDRAAFMMIRYADRMEYDRDLPAARRGYERVAELFPDSPWAVVARRRLSKITDS